MTLTGLCVGVLALAVSTLAVTIGNDDVEIVYFKGGVNKGSVWPTDDGTVADLDGYEVCAQPVFFIPGFMMGRNDATFVDDATTLSANSDYNVFLVNYNNSYLLTAPAIAAPQIVEFQQKLMAKYGFDKSQIILVSFSLGTVVSGYVGRAHGKVGKIIAWDPCGLQFDYLPNSLRLDSSDADFLVCFHTTDLIGTKRNRMCHVNLMYDGGSYPIGCPDINIFCGHAMATSILNTVIHGCSFDFTQCGSYLSYKNGECADNPSVEVRIDMTLQDGQPTVGTQYFYEPQIGVNFTNLGFAYVGSSCSNPTTFTYNDKFC